MVARLKLKGIDGRAPPGVNTLLLSRKQLSAQKGAEMLSLVSLLRFGEE